MEKAGFVGLLTCGYGRGCGLPRYSPAFPELLPVTDFHHGEYLTTYSGGTVWESHPIILFSKYGHTPYLPRSLYLIVGYILAPVVKKVKATVFIDLMAFFG